MNRIIKELLLAVFLGMVMPGVILNSAVKFHRSEQTEIIPTIPVPTVTEPKTSMTIDLTLSDGTEQSMELEDYLVGVVLAEMPADFEAEALKAQSVVARTYTLKCMEAGKHGGGVCSDYACCQAYIPAEDYNGGEENLHKVRSAVMATAGEVLTYNGNLIEATYFSCSGGQTEDAVAVWGTDYPYLRSVESPGEENAAHYTDSVSFTPEAFQTALGTNLSGLSENWFGFTTYTSGGGVNTMRIGGVDYQGTELRSRLGLRSTVFSVSVRDGEIIFRTKGFGHRVGMSQYGADAMAVSGCTYDQILAHYYSGTELREYEN